MTAYSWKWTTLVSCLALAFAGTACKKNNGWNPANATGGNGAAVGTGGSSQLPAGSGGAAVGTGGAGTGSGGTATGTGGTAAGTGGQMAAGTGGSMAMGTGGTGTGGATVGTGGMGAAGSGAAGSAGAGSDAGMVDPSVQSCLDGVMAAGTTVGDCERCLCQAGNCQTELMALKDDAAGNAVVACAKTNNCSGTCCLCGATCDALGSNYAMGPCANEIETAAGVTPGAGAVTNGPMVMTNCATTGPDTNSCARSARLAQCSADKCASACPMQACM